MAQRRPIGIAVSIFLVAAALVSLWFLNLNAFIGGAVLVGILAVLLLIPRTRRAVRSESRYATVRDGHSLCGRSIPYTNLGNAAEQGRERLANMFTRAGWQPETLNVVLWVVHKHDNRSWTIVCQEEGERSRWTATVDGPMSGEDVGLDGRLDPYAAAERLAKVQIDLPIHNVQFLSWGIEKDTSRAVLVGWAETDLTARDLRAHRYEGDDRTAHLAELDPDGAAKAIGWAGSADWRSGALYALARMVDEAGGLKRLERVLEPRWESTIGHVR